MKNYKFLNNVFGWTAFAIATITYFLTIEPTASFWDCPEFITTAYKLEVGHPPGAPFFMLLGRFFTLFASDVTQVALMINILSALASSFTILFLFCSITRLAQKVVTPQENGSYSIGQIIGILGAGMVGALTFAFTDSFWFSAVEGEVYASSSLFTAVVFWAILKWEEVADQPQADRWLIFIAYMMGLSIGVHLLNLLAIPAIVLVYYFKKFEVTIKGTILALLSSFVILGLLMYGLVPGVMTVASWVELLFVNTFGLSFNSGFLFFCILLCVTLIWGVYETFTGKNPLRIKISFILSIALLGIPFIGEKVWLGVLLLLILGVLLFVVFKKLNVRLLNTIMLMLTTIVIGYSSYAVIVIRSTANPPMDQNSPDNVFALKSYLNREQYGDRPLLYGQYYNAEIAFDVKDGYCIPKKKEIGDVWSPKEKELGTENDEYIISDKKIKYIYDDKFCTLFPRMYSSQPNHESAYKMWGNVKGRKIHHESCGREETHIVPTFGENLKFFFEYQLAFMYGRYFMWNFAGRQNDIQGHGEVSNGNTLTGIPFIDNLSLGNQSTLPDDMKNNKGRNVYYLLPLLLGIVGLSYQLLRGKKGVEAFCITGILFFMTGIAIVLYLNQTPYQPRERDYAYAGSFYAFAIWIGFGVLGVMALLQKIFKKESISAALATILCLGVPIQMASQNWDDHDRSGRTTARDFGRNYLESCAPNAIIFTNGDNDTFPLWYLQEVEGIRTDVRVCNLSYLQTDWYIDQMRRESYDSKPLPISWKRYQYVQGVRDVAQVYNLPQYPSMELNTAIDSFLLNPNLLKDGVGALPSPNLYLPIDKEQVLKTNTVSAEFAENILPQIEINLKKNRIFKHEMMILEMLAQNNWERPIYFAVTVGDDYYMGLKDNFQLEGLAYRLVPMSQRGGGVNTNVMFDNMLNKFKWGGIDNPDIYLDENNLRMCRTFRMMFYQLVSALVKEEKNEKAIEALDYCMKVIPGTTVKHDYTSSLLAGLYYQVGEYKKGDAIMDAIANNCVQNATWFMSLTNPQMRESVESELGHNLAVLESILAQCEQAGRTEILGKYVPVFRKYIGR